MHCFCFDFVRMYFCTCMAERRQRHEKPESPGCWRCLGQPKPLADLRGSLPGASGDSTSTNLLGKKPEDVLSKVPFCVSRQHGGAVTGTGLGVEAAAVATGSPSCPASTWSGSALLLFDTKIEVVCKATFRITEKSFGQGPWTVWAQKGRSTCRRP